MKKLSAKEATAITTSGKIFNDFHDKIYDMILEAANKGRYEINPTISWEVDDILLLNLRQELESLGYTVKIASREECKMMDCAQFWDRRVTVRWG